MLNVTVIFTGAPWRLRSCFLLLLIFMYILDRIARQRRGPRQGSYGPPNYHDQDIGRAVSGLVCAISPDTRGQPVLKYINRSILYNDLRAR